MVPDNLGQCAFNITASSMWHVSKENSIQKGSTAPRQPHLVTASDTLGRASAAFGQAFLPLAKRVPSPPLETGTRSPITHYWTAAFVKLRKAAAWRGSDVSWRGVSVTPLCVTLSEKFVCFPSSIFVINPERFNPHLKYSRWIIHVVISPLIQDLRRMCGVTNGGEEEGKSLGKRWVRLHARWVWKHLFQFQMCLIWGEKSPGTIEEPSSSSLWSSQMSWI